MGWKGEERGEESRRMDKNSRLAWSTFDLTAVLLDLIIKGRKQPLGQNPALSNSSVIPLPPSLPASPSVPPPVAYLRRLRRTERVEVQRDVVSLLVPEVDGPDAVKPWLGFLDSSVVVEG